MGQDPTGVGVIQVQCRGVPSVVVGNNKGMGNVMGVRRVWGSQGPGVIKGGESGTGKAKVG